MVGTEDRFVKNESRPPLSLHSRQDTLPSKIVHNCLKAGSRQTFGCRRIAAALNREGIEWSVGLAADLMRELGLPAVQPRGYKRTTIPGERAVDSPDLIGRDFDPTSCAPGERLVGDITSWVSQGVAA